MRGSYGIGLDIFANRSNLQLASEQKERPMGPLQELGDSVAEIAGKVGPSTVGIGNRWRGGSGVVIAKDRVLTNAHNLHGDEVRVYFADGREADATVLGVDGDGDLAVLSAPTEGATPVAWGSTDVGIGTPVVAIGNPAGRGPRVTVGFVSGVGRAFRGPRGRRIGGSVEHTAPLMPGSSGGPLVNVGGEVIGINTNRLGSGFYLAMPTDSAFQARVEALGRGETPSRRHLGVGLAPSHVARRLRRAVGLSERDGLLVREVEEDSPAAKAGVAEGDLIVAAGGREVKSVDDLFDVLGAVGSDQPLELTLLRGDEERTVRVSP
jgi:S1-C subfamily serine protease